jgi:hypothetical protein
VIVPPYPILAGNNKRTPKLTAAIAALNLSPKKENCSGIVMTIVESLILIYTLLVAQAAACIYKLMNKQICKLCNIYISLLITRAIVGSAVLCDVKSYQSKRRNLSLSKVTHKRAFEAANDEFREQELQS